jgi:hypothetical protein
MLFMKKLLTIIGFATLFASCTKSDDTVSTDEILRSGKWGIVGYTVKYANPSGEEVVYNIWSKAPECRYDDNISFEQNFKGKQFSGGNKCTGELDQTQFEWRLKDNEKTLILNGASFTIGNDLGAGGPIVERNGLDYVEAKIERISERSFTISYFKEYNTAPGAAPTKYEFTQVFQK